MFYACFIIRMSRIRSGANSMDNKNQLMHDSSFKNVVLFLVIKLLYSQQTGIFQFPIMICDDVQSY